MSTSNDNQAGIADITALLEHPHSDLLAEALPDYLVRQRWFGSKSRVIRSARLNQITPLDGANAALATIAVTYTEGPAELYQLPLAVSTGTTAEVLRVSTPNAIITTLSTLAGPSVLHDAVVDEGFRARLLKLTASSPDSIGPLPSRLASAEQSNTSILYGDRYILKLYRRLQPGENPDVEIPRFLTSVAHFDHIPAYLGHLRSRDGMTLAFLQAFAPNRGDGWQWMLEKLEHFYVSVVGLPAPRPEGSVNFLVQTPIPPETGQHAESTLKAAALLGQRTAELHLALATPTDNPAFCPESFTPNDLATDSTRIHMQISSALDTLKQSLTSVPADLIDGAASLLSRRKLLLDRAHILATGSPHRFGCRIRVHGDYHLGQVLRTTDDFLIVDFEGEPARSVEERRRKQSPLRDVAGMMRSFSYASFAALDEFKRNHPQHHAQTHAALDSWAEAWEHAASTTFLASYRSAMGANPDLLPQSRQAQEMLLALLLEKALYELQYELNNRPSWLRIPLHGVLSLLHEAV